MPGRGVTRAELEPFFGTLSLPFSSVAYPKKGFGPPRAASSPRRSSNTSRRSSRSGSRPEQGRDRGATNTWPGPKPADSMTIRGGIPLPNDHDRHPRGATRDQLKPNVEEKAFNGVVFTPCRDPYKAFEPRKWGASERTRRTSRKTQRS
jgi:hypothetical protein